MTDPQVTGLYSADDGGLTRYQRSRTRLRVSQGEALLQAKAALLGHRAPLSKRFVTPTQAATIARALDIKRIVGKETRARRKSGERVNCPDRSPLDR